MKNFLFISICILLVSCNPYKKFYTSYYDVSDPDFYDHQGEPKITNVNPDNLEQEHQNLYENGMMMIGHSSFNSPTVNEASLTKFAKTLKAHTVTYYNKFLDSNSSTAGFYNGYSYSFIPVTNTTYNYGAFYWKKLKSVGFGIFPTNLNKEDKKLIGSNKGVKVLAVANGSNAYKSNFIPDDIIVEINGKTVENHESYSQILKSLKGKKNIPFKLFRNGKKKTIRASSAY